MMVQLPLTEEVRSELLSLGFLELEPRDSDFHPLNRYTVATANKYFRPASYYGNHKEISLDELHAYLLLAKTDLELARVYMRNS